MQSCRGEGADPEGVGMAEAVAPAASFVRVNLWTAEGAAVAGREVRLGIRLNLKAEPAAAPAG